MKNMNALIETILYKEQNKNKYIDFVLDCMFILNRTKQDHLYFVLIKKNFYLEAWVRIVL